MYEYISYIFIILFIILFIIYARFKIKYGFWIMQPVFHIYDWWYMIYPPGIIVHELPERNKYTNFKNIQTFLFKDLSDFQLQRFGHFINFNYLKNKDNIFTPDLKNNIIPYFYGHNDMSFVSFYKENIYVTDLKKGTNIQDSQLIGVITTRPIHIYINNKDKDSFFDAYYVDYLCVDKLHRKQGIAPQIIQTHHYNQRHLNKKIVVSLFKREEELTGIVPLCVFSTYGFSMKKWNKPYHLPANYKLLEINQLNFHFLYDFIKNNYYQFDIIINTEISNIIELINTKNLFIYILMKEDKIKCAYFYRKTCVFYDKDLEIINCFASINNFDKTDNNGNKIFIHGFKISFWKTAEKNNFGFAAIENISHNNLIIQNLCIKNKPLVISPTAYFFYNFAYYSFKPNKVLIIN